MKFYRVATEICCIFPEKQRCGPGGTPLLFSVGYHSVKDKISEVRLLWIAFLTSTSVFTEDFCLSIWNCSGILKDFAGTLLKRIIIFARWKICCIVFWLKYTTTSGTNQQRNENRAQKKPNMKILDEIFRIDRKHSKSIKTQTLRLSPLIVPHSMDLFIMLFKNQSYMNPVKGKRY